MRQGLAALREALRQAELRETTLTLQFQRQARPDRRSCWACWRRMEADPGPLLLLHPDGPLGTARSGMMLADVTPALQAEAESLKARTARTGRSARLAGGGGRDADRRAGGRARRRGRRCSQAISDRTDLPSRFTEDPEVLNGLAGKRRYAGRLCRRAVAATTTAAAARLCREPRARCPCRCWAPLLRRPDETDAAGVRRPGLTLATRPGALVTAPWPATIRYRGPLLDYGNVIILEPGDGYLLVLAGLEQVYGEVGEVVAAGAPPGPDGRRLTAAAAEFLTARRRWHWRARHGNALLGTETGRRAGGPDGVVRGHRHDRGMNDR